MAQLISARLPEETAIRMKQYARRKQRSVNETVSLALEEWLRQNEFAFVEFRETRDGRIAYMKNSRIPVYFVIIVARSYEMDIDKVCAYWPNRLRAWVQAAFNYYKAFPDEINTQIELYNAITLDDIKRLLPQMETITVPNAIPRGE